MTQQKGRKIAATAAASVGQPQLDVDALKKITAEHFPDAGADADEEAPASASAPAKPATSTK